MKDCLAFPKAVLIQGGPQFRSRIDLINTPSGSRTVTVQNGSLKHYPLGRIATNALGSQDKCEFQGRPGLDKNNFWESKDI
ncbi:unnamed protein product [Protopolystoma xenopodis]|uniref:Uncharacterized protein n=1 Tax=Protopolystoma xenopodis TaxID=117903 RepID=A0A3S5B959_9PLAT|nr:unnamed protein product [Protopolystoma xenopodis]